MEQELDSAPLRICFVSRALPLHRLGGLEHHLQDLATALTQRGHQVWVLTTALPDKARTGKPLEAPSCAELAIAGSVPLAAGDANFRIHPIPGTIPGDYSIAFYRRVSQALQELHGRENFDILIPVDLAGLFINPAKFDVPVMLLIHGTLRSEVPLDWRFWQHQGFMQKLRILWRYKMRLVLLWAFWRMFERAEFVMVDSEFTRRELMLNVAGGRGRADVLSAGRRMVRAANKCLVVPLGIDGCRYPLTTRQTAAESLKSSNSATQCLLEPNPVHGAPLRICILGRLQRVKGIEIALYAAAQLETRGVDFVMTIGGSGNFAAEAQRLAAELGLESRVFFEGRIRPEDLAGFFARHDLLLFPDLTQPAFGLVAVEAFLHGLPVVAARAGAIPEVVTPDCGWLYDQWDFHGLAALLADLAGEPAAIALKAKRARLRAEIYRADRMGERAELALYAALEKRAKFATGTGK